MRNRKEEKELNNKIAGKSYNILNIANNSNSKHNINNNFNNNLDLISVRSNLLTNNFGFINSKIFFVFFMILIIILIISSISFVNAQSSSDTRSFIDAGSGSYASSNAQYYQPGFNSYNYNNYNAFSGSGSSYNSFGNYNNFGSYSSIYGNITNQYEMCRQGKDFIVQIAPGGCAPMVVRSDLLAEQDVPVFCKLQAMQINPSISVDQIRQISFSYAGNPPAGVRGVSYYIPARMAVPQYGNTGFPSLDNVGYLVLILKQQPNENNLTEFISGNLTARITYNAPYAFGMGVNEKILPVMTDEEWAARYVEYGFMNGKGYMRLDGIQNGIAHISIYSDATHKVDSFSVAQGATSDMRYLSGFYCSAGFSINFISSVQPDTKAVILFDQSSYDVYSKGGTEMTSFAEGQCRVSRIDSDGFGGGRVYASCGGKSFTLELNMKQVILNVNGNANSYSVGDVVNSDNGNNVYLGAVGKKVNGESFVVLVNAEKNSLFNDNLKKQAQLQANRILKNQQTGFINSIDNNFYYFLSENMPLEINGANIKFNGFSLTADASTGDGDFENYFRDAVNGYESTDTLYGSINHYDSSGNSYGQEALEKAYLLASEIGKSKTASEIAQKLQEKYPNSNIASAQINLLNNYQTDKAGTVVDIDGNSHTVILKSITEPSDEDRTIILSVDGIPVTNPNKGDYLVGFGAGGNANSAESVQFIDYNENQIRVYGSCANTNSNNANYQTQNAVIQLGEQRNVCGHNILVRQISVKSFARVRLVPQMNNAGSEVNISYSIGIEKRAIQLSPEQTKERIKKLNDTITKWQAISDNLASMVKAMKAACFATSAALQVKNLFSNLGGKAIARQEVMQGTGGWDQWCEKAVSEGQYLSYDDCMNKNSDAIESDVNAYTQKIDEINKKIETIEDANKNGNIINSQKVAEQYASNLKTAYKNENDQIKDPTNDKSPEIKVNDVLGRLNSNAVSISDMRDAQLAFEMYKSSEAGSVRQKVAQGKLYNMLDNINKAQQSENDKKEAIQNSKDLGIVGSIGTTTSTEFGNTIVDKYDGAVVDNTNGKFDGLTRGTPIQMILGNGGPYYVKLDEVPNNRGQYTFNFDNIYDKNGIKINDDNLKKDLSEKYSSRILQKFDTQSYKNKYQNPLVRYYETEPYKGMPALVPFDLNNGWYAATKQTIGGIGNIKSFQDSGAVSSYWVCNVGQNGKAEFDNGFGDDICMMVNTATGQPTNQFPGLSDKEATQRVQQALKSLQQAASQYKAGITYVTISGAGKIKVGPPASNTPGTKCQDFMSAKDCQLMFNVCDPVICPNSRCNLGGSYQVDDVVQSGIVGSVFLCLPNYKEGIFIPICLTGVQAGIDNWVSILKASRDCLQENLDTGKYVGICDEITAIYTCEFFWKQFTPIMNVVLPKLLEMITGQGTRGGGEYANVQAAWSNMQNSINYFTNVYGLNAMNAYKARSTAEVGTPVCKAFVSIAYANKFKNLIEPDSPYQFSAWFDEIPQSDATVPAISQYKVYYHIFAGNDAGVYYSIYMKDSPGSSYYTQTGVVTVATGFAARGQYADEAKDFTAPSGFKQLCVRINNKENCGFKQVSTSFALNYVKDQYVKSQVTDTNIKSDQACVSGTTTSALSMVNPNLQAGVQETINPQIYNRGIIRVCASDNPGSTTEPDRWKKVGTCDDQSIGCWIDTQSINNAYTAGNNKIRSQTTKQLDDITKNIITREQGQGILVGIDAANTLFAPVEEKILVLRTMVGVLEDTQLSDANIISAQLSTLEHDYQLTEEQKARVLFDRAWLNDVMARDAKQKYSITQQESATESTPISNGNSGRGISQSNTDRLSSADVVLKDGVKVDELKEETIQVILSICYALSCNTANNEDNKMIITSGIDGTHVKDSAHYKGLAFDLRDNSFSKLLYGDANELNDNNFKSKYSFPKDSFKVCYETLTGTGTCSDGNSYTGAPSTENHYHVEVYSNTQSAAISIPIEYSQVYLTASSGTNDEIINTFAQSLNVNFYLIKAMIDVESKGQSSATSSAGAQGIMQVTQNGVNEVNTNINTNKLCGDIKPYKVNNVNQLNGQDNIERSLYYGICYLKLVYSHYKFSDVELALAAYNAGPTAVRDSCKDNAGNLISFKDCKNKLPSETQDYVPNVINVYNNYVAGVA